MNISNLGLCASQPDARPNRLPLIYRYKVDTITDSVHKQTKIRNMNSPLCFSFITFTTTTYFLHFYDSFVSQVFAHMFRNKVERL